MMNIVSRIKLESSIIYEAPTRVNYSLSETRHNTFTLLPRDTGMVSWSLIISASIGIVAIAHE